MERNTFSLPLQPKLRKIMMAINRIFSLFLLNQFLCDIRFIVDSEI